MEADGIIGILSKIYEKEVPKSEENFLNAAIFKYFSTCYNKL